MSELDEEARRVIAFLARGEARVEQSARLEHVLLGGEERSRISARVATLGKLAQSGILERGPDWVRLKPDYRSLTAGAADQHRDIEFAGVGGEGPAVVNRNESPLSQLFRRRDRAGTPFLTEAEFRAGERLRADYTRAGIMPRLGANWIASVSTGRRGGAGGTVELTDAALAARQRVERAISAVGPELAGVLIDVCCFLKGMELVEAERRWPVRSAKLMLKAGLGALSRHYHPDAKPPSRQTLHWGTDDYKPR